MRNIGSIIKAHNKDKKKPQRGSATAREKKLAPLGGRCLVKEVNVKPRYHSVIYIYIFCMPLDIYKTNPPDLLKSLEQHL